MKKTSFLLLCIILLGGFNLKLYSKGISINSIMPIEHFPSNSVQRILQDSDGYLWFGTLDGLCRYDGYRIMVFRSDMNNLNLLTNNEITCLAEDNNHNILIGTKEGLNILNRETLQISHFADEEIQKEYIKCILAASDGSIWIGAEDHVFRFDPEHNTKELFTGNELPVGGVNSIYEDKYGDIWILLWGAGLHKYKKDGTFTHYPTIGKANIPFKIFQDNNNQYWICTWGEGLYQFFPNNNQQSMYTKHQVYNNDGKHTEDIFFSIVQDDVFGYIWVVSFSGIYALEYTSDHSLRQVDISHLFKKTNNIFSELIKDRDGNLWVATFNEGAFTINFDKPDIQNLEFEYIRDHLGLTPNITVVFEDRNGLLWMNQNRYGLCMYDQNTDKTYTFSNFNSLKNIAGMKDLACILGARNTNDIWLGSYDEPYIYIVEKNIDNIIIKKHIDLTNIYPTAGNIRLFFEDSKNNIWIVTTTNVFIKQYDSEDIKLVNPELNKITAITEDARGSLWMSSENSGIFQTEFINNRNVSDLKIRNYNRQSKDLISNNITTICADINGKIWLGTHEGNIIYYDENKQKFEDYTKRCQLTGEAIQDIIADKFNNIWIKTNKRIIEYNSVNGASRDYSTSDGLLVNSFLEHSYHINNNKNKIYFGGNNGICIFTPSERAIVPLKAKNVSISDVKIQGQSVTIDAINPKFRTISQELVLDPYDKNIEIDFTSHDYTYPGKIMYAYQMKGVDDDWIYTTRQFATYNRLKKGTNIFHVKATDENRLWSSNITTLKIYKHPAFYETWWAYVIYMLIILTGIYIIFKIIRNRIKLQHKLKIAQIEKEKSEDLTQTKLRYFTNISHDFLTPLTILSCLIDDIETILKRKIPQFEIMRSNVNRLNRLLQQVLDFRKMESGNIRLKVSNGDIVAFVQDVCYNNFAPLMEKKKINFQFVSDSPQIQAYFDADKIDKIVHNILSNALKYTSKGGDITVRLKMYEMSDFSYLKIKISDTGIGIHPENVENIFKRFFYNKDVDASETNGIGLSLTRDLVELHRGSISVESELNVGSIFSIDIPIDEMAFTKSEFNQALPIIIKHEEEEEEDDDFVNNEKQHQLPEDDKVSQKESINLLLVEDNEDILHTIKNILQKRYNVLTAINGTIALNTIKNNDIDIIVSDVMMPEMDGLELCRTIKSNIETSHISMLLLTAKNSVEDRIECYNAGADGYISKPFDVKVLEARINNFLVNKRNKQTEFKSNVEINIETLNYPSLDEQFLNKAVQVIEEHLSDNDFDITVFAGYLNMSKSSLYRKMKTMTSLPPNEFIRNIRLKHACQILKDKSRSISEVAYSIGFTDPHYFATCFKAEFDMTPSEFQKKQ